MYVCMCAAAPDETDGALVCCVVCVYIYNVSAFLRGRTMYAETEGLVAVVKEEEGGAIGEAKERQNECAGKRRV